MDSNQKEQQHPPRRPAAATTAGRPLGAPPGGGVAPAAAGSGRQAGGGSPPAGAAQPATGGPATPAAGGAARPASGQQQAWRPAAGGAGAATGERGRPGAVAMQGVAPATNDRGQRGDPEKAATLPSYLRMAFANPYNLSLMGGGLAAALLTANPLLALGTLGFEAIWLLFAPDSKRLRHILWDPRFARLKEMLDSEERARRLAGLPDEALDRVNALVARQSEIRRLAAENPTFAGNLMQGELVKTDRLVDAFIEMARTCARYEAYLESADPAELERQRRYFEQAAADAGDDAAAASIAKRNLAVVAKRAEKQQEIRRYLSVAKGQLDLIENSFQLIADQIVTMQSPQELSGQLDDLLDGVEAVRETSRETEQLLGGTDHTP